MCTSWDPEKKLREMYELCTPANLALVKQACDENQKRPELYCYIRVRTVVRFLYRHMRNLRQTERTNEVNLRVTAGRARGF